MFNSFSGSAKQSIEGEGVPWKRVELAVKRFSTTTQIDLSRLSQHKKNIMKLEKTGDRVSVHQELSKAHQTMEQLRKNLAAMEKIGQQVKVEDRQKFDDILSPTKLMINETIMNFRDLDQDHTEFLGEDFYQLLQQDAGTASCTAQLSSIGHLSEAQLEAELDVAKSDAEVTKHIADNLEHVKDIMSTLSSMVHDQKEQVDTIENNIQKAHENVHLGGLQMTKAAGYKAAGFTVLGAAVGTLIGGPVGLIAGAKIGLLAAGAGGAIGIIAGNKIKKIRNERIEVELQNLNAAKDMIETRQLRSQSGGED